MKYSIIVQTVLWGLVFSLPSQSTQNHDYNIASLSGKSKTDGNSASPYGENRDYHPLKELFPLPNGFFTEPQLNRSRTPRARLVKQRSRPIVMGGMRVTNGANMAMASPCSSCYITAMQGGLEYEDGTPAYPDTGSWLHHMVLGINTQRDLTCSKMGLLNVPYPNRIYACGSERQVARINVDGQKYGIEVGPTDRLGMIYELMNENAEPKTVRITMMFEVVDRLAASGYKAAKMAWMDVGGCLDPDFLPPLGEKVFSKTTPTWVSTVNGKLLSSLTHTHDGGTHMELFINNRMVCDGKLLYGRKAGYILKDGMKHISDASSCTNFGQIHVGDRVHMVSYYNLREYTPMKSMNGAGLEPLMGINQFYIGL